MPQFDASTTVASSSRSPKDPPSKELEKEAPAKEPIRRLDFGFLPILPKLRHDPEKPFHFSLGLNIFFGIASTLSKYVRPVECSISLTSNQLWATCTSASPFLVRKNGTINNQNLTIFVVRLAETFGVTEQQVTLIPTLTQAG